MLGLNLAIPAFAQSIPDPNKVAPQYRDAAEKRRAELVRQRACETEAYKEKIVKRDLAPFVIQCMDAAEKAEQIELAPNAKK